MQPTHICLYQQRFSEFNKTFLKNYNQMDKLEISFYKNVEIIKVALASGRYEIFPIYDCS